MLPTIGLRTLSLLNRVPECKGQEASRSVLIKRCAGLEVQFNGVPDTPSAQGDRDRERQRLTDRQRHTERK